MTDYQNKMILCYDSQTGRGLHTVEYPWPEGILEFYDEKNIHYVVTDKVFIDSLYVENNEAKVRPEACWIVPGQPLGVGEDFIIRNLPQGAKVTVGPETYIVDDGIFEFSSDVPEIFPFSVECWPYYSTEGNMVFQ